MKVKAPFRIKRVNARLRRKYGYSFLVFSRRGGKWALTQLIKEAHYEQAAVLAVSSAATDPY
jgi:hypothetical protein